MNIPEVTLRCSNGFTLHTRGPNLVVEAKRTEEFFPIAKIQSFALKEPRGLGMGKITFHTAQAAPEGKVVSVVEEIRGLKELLDDGILTSEEFDAKKRQLLGL